MDWIPNHYVCTLSRAISGIPLWLDPPHATAIIVDHREGMLWHAVEKVLVFAGIRFGV
jgi:hypothetical protein